MSRVTMIDDQFFNCNNCKKQFIRKLDYKNNRTRYCNKKCYNDYLKKTWAETLIKHPGWSIKSGETYKRLYLEGKINTWNKGLSKDIDERIKKHSEFMKGRKNPHTKEWGEKISKGKLGYQMSIITKEKIRLKKTGIPMKELHKEKIKLSMSTKKNKLWAKNNAINMRKSGIFNLKPTKPEQKLIQLFQQHNFPFEYIGDAKFHIGYFNPDFIWEEGKKIIEFDGKYWHSLPYTMNKDEERNLAYLDAGYDIMVINEDNLKDENKLLQDIQQFWSDVL